MTNKIQVTPEQIAIVRRLADIYDENAYDLVTPSAGALAMRAAATACETLLGEMQKLKRWRDETEETQRRIGLEHLAAVAAKEKAEAREAVLREAATKILKHECPYWGMGPCGGVESKCSYCVDKAALQSALASTNAEGMLEQVKIAGQLFSRLDDYEQCGTDGDCMGAGNVWQDVLTLREQWRRARGGAK